MATRKNQQQPGAPLGPGDMPSMSVQPQAPTQQADAEAMRAQLPDLGGEDAGFEAAPRSGAAKPPQAPEVKPLPSAEEIARQNPRNAVISRIGREQAAELHGLDVPTDPEPMGDDDLEAAGRAAEAAAAAAEGGGTDPQAASPAGQGEAPPQPGTPPTTRRIKVDGREIEVPLDQIIERGVATLQKETAADVRLREADRLLREIQQHHASTMQPGGMPAQPAMQPAPGQTPAGNAAVPGIDDAVIDSLYRRMQYGNEQDGKRAMAELLALARAGAPSAEQLGQVIQNVRSQAADEAIGRIEMNNAFRDVVQGEYSEIANDPTLFRIFVEREAQARATGDSRPHRELYRAIGEEMRGWIGGFAPSTGSSPTPSGAAPASNGGSSNASVSERVQAKRRLPSAVTGAAGRQPETVQPQPQTPSTIIERMAQMRGQRLIQKR